MVMGQGSPVEDLFPLGSFLLPSPRLPKSRKWPFWPKFRLCDIKNRNFGPSPDSSMVVGAIRSVSAFHVAECAVGIQQTTPSPVESRLLIIHPLLVTSLNPHPPQTPYFGPLFRFLTGDCRALRLIDPLLAPTGPAPKNKDQLRLDSTGRVASQPLRSPWLKKD